MRALLALTLLIGALSGPLRAGAESVTVFAAASLAGVLEPIAEEAPQEVSLSYAGSGAIARQVAAGAPVDLIILASPLWMSWLGDRGLLGGGQPRAIASNRLVLIGPRDAAPIAPEAIADRLGEGRLAMGHRSAVPAGAYARQWLEAAGLWDRIEARLAETDNVRAALALVARGQASLGIVYATDAHAEDRVSVLYEIPAEAHDPILYPAAALTPAGVWFMDLLKEEAAQSRLRAAGFAPVPKAEAD